MKQRIHYLMSAAGLLAGFAVSRAAEESKPAVKKEGQKEMRVMSAPERGQRMLHRKERGEIEKETVAFLGVETGPVSPAVSTQLGLQRGTGLVVNHLVPQSPAAAVLQQHDILLQLDDQILIETRQLAVLIRNKKEGDEITLTYLRGGTKASVKVKLGKHEVPKFSLEFAPAAGAFALGFGPERFEMFVPRADGGREEVDRVLSLLQRGPGAPDGPPGFVPRAPRIRVGHDGEPGVRSISVNTRNSNLVYSDDDGSLDLTIKDGVKRLVAKDAKGTEIFSGPVTTPEERDALPDGVRERLDKLERMQDVTFHTDGDFRGAEATVVRPRGIALPLPPPPPKSAPLPRRASVLF